ncbi:MAG: hypothetical protein H0U70_00440 [Tatlockia sp.]|nr:hypothetical protein [Tatlockia sp.]
MLEIILPSAQQKLKVDLDYASGINNPTPTLQLLSNLDEFNEQKPSLDAFIHYVLADDILFDIRGIECFPLRQQAALQDLLSEKHPTLCTQLYEHSISLQGLALDILTLNQKGVTPKNAIERLILGLILGGEKMTGQRFAGKSAKDAVDRFFAWFNALPNPVQEQLRAIEGNNTTLGRIIDNELGKGTCVETAATSLKSILRKNKQETILTSPPEMRPMDLKALRDKYGPKKPLDTRKDGLLKFIFPSQLTEEALKRTNPETNEQFISLILDFPPTLYKVLWKNLRLLNPTKQFKNLAKFINTGFFNAEQKKALAQAVRYQCLNGEFHLDWAITIKDKVFLKEALKLYSYKKINIHEASKVLHSVRANPKTLKIVLNWFEQHDRLCAVRFTDSNRNMLLYITALHFPQSFKVILEHLTLGQKRDALLTAGTGNMGLLTVLDFAQLNLACFKVILETFPLLQPLAIDGEIPINGNLLKSFLCDNRLWAAIQRSGQNQFSIELAQDLVELHRFHGVYSSNIYGKDYADSINRFYERALDIRLSGTPIKVQAQNIVAAAHEEFKHRDKGLRLLADALLLISILFGGLGLVIMAGRYCTSNSVFFSQSKTRREERLNGIWMKNQNEIDDLAGDRDPESFCLFN